ncbi:type II secretion system F family protein [Kitasatospora sp. NPDC006697]|uniref:type II secretion system F family protein n=1 Tax=Kitasatospora sp. NPDC006697 TaxID=3364020 RepID=UPI0036C3095B
MSGLLSPYSVAPAVLPAGLLAAVALSCGTVVALCAGRLARSRLRRRALYRRTLRLAPPAATADRKPAGRRRRPTARAPGGAAALAVLAGALTAWLLPGALGAPTGVLVAAVAWRLAPALHSPANQRADRERELLTAQLPLAADLLAACLGSATSPAQAAEAVARTVGGPMERRLSGTAAELALGAHPEACWDRFGAGSAVLAPLARCLIRTTVSGAPPAQPLRELAASQRSAAARAAHARVRRAGVLATAPLGLCFLPAFVLIGIAPVVVGLVSTFADRL